MFYNEEHKTKYIEFFNCLVKIVEILIFWRNHTSIDGEKISAKNLLNFIIEQTIQIITEIRHKLIYKACCQFNIISFSRPNPIVKNEKNNEIDVSINFDEAAEPAE
jgi:hypothetical protein